MRNIKVLEMLNNGRIEELKAALQDEIYTESLKSKPNKKKRYAAMKKYFTYYDSGRESLQKPCEVEIEGNKYTSFCNAYSIALTRETCGEMELFDNPEHYPDVSKLITYNGQEGKIDFATVFAEAKSKGYKLKKSEVGFDYKYLMHYGGAYFKLGLVDSTLGIIDDGNEAIVYHVEGARKPLTITTDIGVCVVMPVFMEGNPEDEDKIVIEVEG